MEKMVIYNAILIIRGKKMRLSYPKKSNSPFLALAFAFPFFGMLLVMLISQYEPFGDYSILYSDMYHQYYPFFVAFRQALRSGESLLYSWSVGLGMDYLGLIAYYLASPLNLLSVLIPEGWLLEYFSLLVPVRLGLAGLFFAIFLKNIFNRDDLSISLFGACYGLCAWALGYLWNIMWLDTFALLPLVALGTVSLLRDRKFLLYTVSLFLSVFSNYYIGLFTCIFVFLLFFVYEICRWQGFGRFFRDLGAIAFFSVLAIGMTAILELPAYAALQTTQSSVNQFPKGFKMNIANENTWKGLFDAMRQVAGNMSGGVSPTFKEGLPNLYCGVGTLMLAFLYLMSNKVKLKDKVAAVVLLVFFMLSFILRQLDYIWHGFHFTNMIPYRFSFLYSFVMLYMAYRAWLLRRSFRPWQILMASGLSCGIFACANMAGKLELVGENPGDSWIFLLYNGLFMAAYAALLMFGAYEKPIPEEPTQQLIRQRVRGRRRRQAQMTLAFLVVMALEMTMNLVNFGINFTGTSISGYPKGTEYAASMIRYMKEREEDTLFYRAETTHSQTLNDGALNGYHGVSAFTSSANVKVTEFMQAFGYGAKNTYNRYCYEEASPVADLFLNLKYMIERNGRERESAYFTQIHRYGDVALLQFNYQLPLGFLTQPDLAEFQFVTKGNSFKFQNAIMKYATGIWDDVWLLMTDSETEITGTDVTIKDQSSNGYCAYENGKKGGIITYTYQVNADGFMCVNLDFPKRNNVSIWKNGQELYNETTSLEQMMAVGDVVAGDVVEVRASCKNSNESGTLTVNAAILNQERFEACYEVLSASTLELTEFSNTRIRGNIHCDRDGLLYTSIPQNGNWFVRVDGEAAESLAVGEAMTAVMLTEGTHEVEFYYHNAAFALGWKISLGCAVILLVLVYLQDQRKKTQ